MSGVYPTVWTRQAKSNASVVAVAAVHMPAGGDTVQTYEYSVYGQVAAEDPNHPNPYMFTGRRFDAEIGLYYYRARYYDPFTGRFLQTDPIGYEDGMNWYLYCKNKPLNFADPYGLAPTGQVVTGRYIVVPWNWAQDLRELPGGVTALSALLGDSVIDLWELRRDSNMTTEEKEKKVDLKLGELATKFASPDLGLSYFAAKYGLPDLNPDLRWGAFIEVKDWNDKDDDRSADRNDVYSSPYWLYVDLLGSGRGEDYERGTGVQEPYLTRTDAAGAAGTAIGLAWNMGIKRKGYYGVVPTLQEVEGFLLPKDQGDDPYNRDGGRL